MQHAGRYLSLIHIFRGCRELALLHDLLQRIAYNIADVILSRVYRVNLFPLDIEANGTVTGLRHFHCQMCIRDRSSALATPCAPV